MVSPPGDPSSPPPPPVVGARRNRRRTRSVWALSSLVTVGLATAGWIATGRHLEATSMQHVADTWLGFRRCLLGSAPERSGVAATERIRLLRLRDRHRPDAAWPGRCRPLAEAFDRARDAPALRQHFGALPRATTIVDAPEEQGASLVALVTAMEEASLPLARPGAGEVPPPPPVPRPRLDAAALRPFARAGSARTDVTVFAHPDGDRLAVRDGDHVRLCRIEPVRVTCHDVPLDPAAARGRIRLAAAGDTLSLLRLEDGPSPGFYDAATGTLLFGTAYFGAQAFADREVIRVLTATTDGPRGQVEHHRAVELIPGRRPRKRRLRSVPARARTLLIRDRVYWILPDGTNGDALTGLPVREAEPRDATPPPPTMLPAGSRPLDRCHPAAGDVWVLFGNGLTDRQFSLVRFGRKGGEVTRIDVGTSSSIPSLTCFSDHAELLAVEGDRLVHWRCHDDDDACPRTVSHPLPRDHDHTHAAFAPTGDGEVALLWQRDGDALRLRRGGLSGLHRTPDILLTDTPSRGGFEAINVRLLPAADGGGLVALLQDPALELYAVRLDPRGTPSPLKTDRAQYTLDHSR
ncbi:MAG: hypothetical protein AAF715_03145 [Myxococcota bacterium]